MMRYEIVVALVVGALFIIPVVLAGWTLFSCALVSPMLRHFGVARRGLVLTMIVAAWLYFEYIGWAVAHRWAWEDTSTQVFIIGYSVGVMGAFVLLGAWAWRLMSTHRAFDLNGTCGPWALRRILLQYFASSKPPNEVKLRSRYDAVDLMWGNTRQIIRPAENTTCEQLLATAHACFPPDLNVVVITRKDAGYGLPRARYQDELDTVI
jgi:hypothetical protein